MTLLLLYVFFESFKEIEEGGFICLTIDKAINSYQSYSSEISLYFSTYNASPSASDPRS